MRGAKESVALQWRHLWAAIPAGLPLAAARHGHFGPNGPKQQQKYREKILKDIFNFKELLLSEAEVDLEPRQPGERPWGGGGQ